MSPRDIDVETTTTKEKEEEGKEQQQLRLDRRDPIDRIWWISARAVAEEDAVVVAWRRDAHGGAHRVETRSI